MNFEKALLYQSVKKEVAKNTLDEIENIGIVENFDRVKEFLDCQCLFFKRNNPINMIGTKISGGTF